MKASEIIATLPAATVYLRALWNYMLYPHARTLPTWCHHPRQCRLKHTIVLIKPPKKPARFVFKHIEVS